MYNSLECPQSLCGRCPKSNL